MDKKGMLESLILHYENGNKSNFSKRLGLTPQAISTWLKRETFDASLIYANCEDINPAWLLSGEGSMVISQTEKETHITDTFKKENFGNDHPIIEESSGNTGIPLIPLSAMAGAFTIEQQVLEYECERYVIPAFKDADFLITVKGTSMIPKFHSGDVVACKRLHPDSLFFQWNKVYVLDTDQGPLIKRVKRGSDKNHVMIVSENQEYEPFELSLKHIYHVALVVGLIRLE